MRIPIHRSGLPGVSVKICRRRQKRPASGGVAPCGRDPQDVVDVRCAAREGAVDARVGYSDVGFRVALAGPP